MLLMGATALARCGEVFLGDASVNNALSVGPGFLCCRSCKTHAFDMADKPSIKYFISQRLHSAPRTGVGEKSPT